MSIYINKSAPSNSYLKSLPFINILPVARRCDKGRIYKLGSNIYGPIPLSVAKDISFLNAEMSYFARFAAQGLYRWGEYTVRPERCYRAGFFLLRLILEKLLDRFTAAGHPTIRNLSDPILGDLFLTALSDVLPAQVEITTRFQGEFKSQKGIVSAPFLERGINKAFTDKIATVNTISSYVIDKAIVPYLKNKNGIYFDTADH
ncbi:MAG: hypothetical protein PHH14_04520 [Candidatus Margulisbacteria bacterium]|nr:hypothetical protein [Candidatus Margulisiibacteriota bacterium]